MILKPYYNILEEFNPVGKSVQMRSMHISESAAVSETEDTEVVLALLLPVLVILIFLCYLASVLWRCFIKDKCLDYTHGGSVGCCMNEKSSEERYCQTETCYITVRHSSSESTGRDIIWNRPPQVQTRPMIQTYLL